MAKRAAARKGKTKRTYDALRDTVDFRDRMYVPTLVEVPSVRSLTRWTRLKVPVLDQGNEGACTGFGLATVANYLLRQLADAPDKSPVSARMFYEMARRYDEWPGEDYEGSSARGAMKGWHKHGVCAGKRWPYDPATPDFELTHQRALDAMRRPLGAYFRVNHRDLVAMHSAITEVGVLYATATVHDGWERVNRRTGVIPFPGGALGGHAFAIVGYDTDGLWIQNSWGAGWGRRGFARISYDDWLQNGSDVWVARLGAPIRLRDENSTAAMRSAAPRAYEGYTFCALRPHIISIGNDGLLRRSGTFATGPEQVKTMIGKDLAKATADWPKRRILLYAHGGLVDEESAVQRIADYRQPLLDAKIFPLTFAWRSDIWTTFGNILEDALGRRRSEGLLDVAKDFMLDRLDDTIEPIARAFSGKAAWDEMKENALGATTQRKGGARLVLEELLKLDKLEIHVIGHSAGAIFLAPLVKLLTTKGKISGGLLDGETGFGHAIKSCTLWAPACTIDLFKDAYLPAIERNTLEKLTLFTLTDQAEQDDDCVRIYNKSLLYLVSNAFEDKPRIPPVQKDLDDVRKGAPLLGLERSIDAAPAIAALFKSGRADWIRAPNESTDPLSASNARHHGDFDDDEATVKASFGRILGAPVKKRAGKEKEEVKGKLVLQPLPQVTQDRRQRLDRTMQN
jgi:hypothetical protein